MVKQFTLDDGYRMLTAYAEGSTDEVIARYYGCSTRTVRRMMLDLQTHSRTRNRVNLVAWAMLHGKIRPALPRSVES